MKKKINNLKKLKQTRRLLRNNMTKPEIILWSKLKNNGLGVKFRRQHSIGNYIVDFYCPKLKIAIELDGDQHFYEKGKIKDNTRAEFIEKQGINIIRIPNIEIYKNIDGVLQGLWDKITKLQN